MQIHDKKFNILPNAATAAIGIRNNTKGRHSTLLLPPVNNASFDGAHLTMPKYTDSYQTVKNLAPVADCLKVKGRAE